MPKDEFADTEKWLEENYFPKKPYNKDYDYTPPKDFDPRGYAPYGEYETTKDVKLKKGVTNFPMNWWFSAQAVEFWETILGIKQALKNTYKQRTRISNPFEPYGMPKRRSPMDYYDEIMRDRSRKMYDDLRKGELE